MGKLDLRGTEFSLCGFRSAYAKSAQTEVCATKIALGLNFRLLDQFDEHFLIVRE
jgi:hypothetical protein